VGDRLWAPDPPPRGGAGGIISAREPAGSDAHLLVPCRRFLTPLIKTRRELLCDYSLTVPVPTAVTGGEFLIEHSVVFFSGECVSDGPVFFVSYSK